MLARALVGGLGGGVLTLQPEYVAALALGLADGVEGVGQAIALGRPG